MLYVYGVEGIRKVVRSGRKVNEIKGGSCTSCARADGMRRTGATYLVTAHSQHTYVHNPLLDVGQVKSRIYEYTNSRRSLAKA